MKKVDILDCTLRDGSYLTGFSVTRQATEEVVADLDAAGVKYIEVGHGMGLGARNKFHSLETDETYIRAAVSRRKKAMIGCFFIPSFGTKEQIATGRDLGMDFIRIGSNITEHESMKPYVDYAKEVGLKVFVNLMKTYAVSPEKLR
ncbi:MAG: 4-hydroxy-2-oxovalerate aldolase, partial [Bdellovibrionales bacterium]